MRTIVKSIAIVAALIGLIAGAGTAKASETAKLKGAHIKFETGDNGKKPNTRLIIQVYCKDGSTAAKNDPSKATASLAITAKTG
jgi:hypothetical protein